MLWQGHKRPTFLPNSSRSSGLPRDLSTSLRWLYTHPVWKDSDVLQQACMTWVGKVCLVKWGIRKVDVFSIRAALLWPDAWLWLA